MLIVTLTRISVRQDCHFCGIDATVVLVSEICPHLTTGPLTTSLMRLAKRAIWNRKKAAAASSQDPVPRTLAKSWLVYLCISLWTITRLGKADSPATKTGTSRAGGFVTARVARKDIAMTSRTGETTCVKNSKG